MRIWIGIFITVFTTAGWLLAKDASYIRQRDGDLWRVEMYQESEERDIRAQLLGEINEIDIATGILEKSVGTEVEVSILAERRAKLAQEVVYLNSPDASSPTVKITEPANNATVSGQIIIAAEVYDDRDIPLVQFKIDGANLGLPTVAYPYAFRFNSATVPNGIHILSATGIDAVGNVGISATISINVSN